jgi:hypothetical protein
VDVEALMAEEQKEKKAVRDYSKVEVPPGCTLLDMIRPVREAVPNATVRLPKKIIDSDMTCAICMNIICEVAVSEWRAPGCRRARAHAALLRALCRACVRLIARWRGGRGLVASWAGQAYAVAARLGCGSPPLLPPPLRTAPRTSPVT